MTLAISTAELVERFSKGESVSYLADQYQCSRGTVFYRLNQAGARTRTRSKLNARVMLTAHRPVLLGLLGQLEKTLEIARDRLVEAGSDVQSRRKYMQHIEKLEDQVHALKAITSAVAKRVDSAQEDFSGSK